MQQTVDALLEFDERTVVGEVANLASDDRFLWVLVHDSIPRVGNGLLDTERQLLTRWIDTENLDFDFVADLNQLVRMIDAACP